MRTFVGLHAPTDITPLSDGSVLVADQGAREILSFDPVGGTVLLRREFKSGVLRARPRAGGGFVVTSIDKVLLTNAALEVEREIPVKGVRVAVELPNGHLLTASNEEQGWLTEHRPDSSIRWRSKPRARLDPAGKWVSESDDQTFVSTSSLDVRSDGAIFAADFDGHTLRLLTSDYRLLRFWSVKGQGHFSDTRFGPSGELVFVAPETQSVWVEFPDGKIRAWTTAGPSVAFCANLSLARTLLVGFRWQPEAERLNASQRPAEREAPFHETLFGVVLFGASSALLVGIIVRRTEIEAAIRSRIARRRAEPAGTLERTGDALPDADFSEPAARTRRGARTAAIATCLAALAVASYVAWGATRGTEGGVADGKMLEFALACLAGGAALRFLNGILGTSDTLSRFSPPPETVPPRPTDHRRAAALVFLALSCLTICLLAVYLRPDRSGLGVGTWAAAQILLLAAAFELRPKPASHFRKVGPDALLLGVILLGAIGARFWQLAYYPDFIHWDHGIYGRAALRVLLGEWSPFFVMDPNSQSISRPWVAVCSALLGLFGHHYWVLRFTGAISGVVLVLATYLLGSSLFNRRVGLVAASLAAVTHVLLLYSRQPYVLDPAPLFVLALYCAVVGLKRGSRFHWCLAGVLSGWTMLTYWASTALGFVGAAILGGFVLFYPRWLWRNRMGLLWMLLGLAVVYLPMVPHVASSANLSARLHETTSVFNPDDSIQRDPAFWRGQIQQTFGMILHHGERSPWGLTTGKPIAIGPETLLFGIGLTYLLLSRPRAPALLLLAWLGVGFFVGNGLFQNPTTLYHCLAALPPILIMSGVTVDRFLALTDCWKSRRLRFVLAVAAVLLLGFIGLLHLRTVWSLVGRPPARQREGRLALRADIRSIVPRLVRENPRYRYYLVRTSIELTCAEPSFIFFADDSDISDVTGDLREVLPVPPAAGQVGAAFVVLPRRSRDAAHIRAVYPDAQTLEVLSTDTPEPVRILFIGADSVRWTFEASAKPHDLARTGSPASRVRSRRDPPATREPPG